MLSARRESRVRGSLKAQACSLRALGFSGGELGNGREPDLPFKFNASFFGGWRFFVSLRFEAGCAVRLAFVDVWLLWGRWRRIIGLGGARMPRMVAEKRRNARC